MPNNITFNRIHGHVFPASSRTVEVEPLNEEFWRLTKTISRSPIQYNTLPISFIPRRTSTLSSDFVPQLSCSLTSLIHPAYRKISIQVEVENKIHNATPFSPLKNKKDKSTKDNDHVFIHSIPKKEHNLIHKCFDVQKMF